MSEQSESQNQPSPKEVHAKIRQYARLQLRREIQQARDRLQAIGHRLDELRQRTEPLFRRYLERFVDHETLAHLLSSMEVARQHLAHPDPRLRRAAIAILMRNREEAAQCLDDCEEMIRNEPDVEARREAISVLGRYYSSTRDSRVACLFATIVLSEQEPDAIRSQAYHSLRVVCCSPRPVNFDRPRPRFPEDVDWDFVGRYATG